MQRNRDFIDGKEADEKKMSAWMWYVYVLIQNLLICYPKYFSFGHNVFNFI